MDERIEALGNSKGKSATYWFASVIDMWHVVKNSFVKMLYQSDETKEIVSKQGKVRAILYINLNPRQYTHNYAWHAK